MVCTYSLIGLIERSLFYYAPVKALMHAMAYFFKMNRYLRFISLMIFLLCPWIKYVSCIKKEIESRIIKGDNIVPT